MYTHFIECLFNSTQHNSLANRVTI